MGSPQPEHACTAPMDRTLRARLTAELQGTVDGPSTTLEARAAAAALVDLDRWLMALELLCPECGYPLDNSYPHPATRLGRGRGGGVASRA